MKNKNKLFLDDIVFISIFIKTLYETKNIIRNLHDKKYN